MMIDQRIIAVELLKVESGEITIDEIEDEDVRAEVQRIVELAD